MTRYRKLINDKRVQATVCIALILAAWELAARLALVNAYILPPFSHVCAVLTRDLFTGNLGEQTWSSLRVVFAGFALSFLLAVAATGMCVASQWCESLFDALTTILNPLPAVAVMPLVIMWFGIGETAMYILIIHGVLWTMIRHLLDGLRSVPAVQMEFGRNIELSPLQMFSGVIMFAVMPELIAGLRVAWGRAWRALISAEMVFGMVGASGGLGHYIYMGRAYSRISDVFAGMIVIALIGMFAESFVFARIERHTTQKWGMTRA